MLLVVVVPAARSDKSQSRFVEGWGLEQSWFVGGRVFVSFSFSWTYCMIGRRPVMLFLSRFVRPSSCRLFLCCMMYVVAFLVPSCRGLILSHSFCCCCCGVRLIFPSGNKSCVRELVWVPSSWVWDPLLPTEITTVPSGQETKPKTARECERHHKSEKGRGWVGNGETAEGESDDSE